MDFRKYTYRQHKPLPPLLIDVLGKLSAGGYDTWVDCDKGCLRALVVLEKPFMYLRVVKLSADAKSFEMYTDKNSHPRQLTTLHNVRKLLGVEGELSDDGSPF